MVWRIWGNGLPLVLLHGGYGSWLHWVTTMEVLECCRTLYVPDLPGLGDSDEAQAPGGLSEIAQAVSDGMRDLRFETGVDLVGFSFGAAVSGHVALRTALNSLTLVGVARWVFPVRR